MPQTAQSIRLVKTVPGVSETYLKIYKKSKVLIKKEPNNGKTLSQLTTYPNGRYSFVEFTNGKPSYKIANDPEIGARHYIKLGKLRAETKEKTLYNGLEGVFNWYMDFYNEAGQRIKQIIR